MKESSRHILIAEYDRLKVLEQNRLEVYQSSVRFYLTVISVSTGVVVVFASYPYSSGSFQFNIIAVLGLIFVLGIATYTRLLGQDEELIEISKRYYLIRRIFIQEDRELTSVFPEILINDADLHRLSVSKYRSWASILGILSRSFVSSGPKTIVALLNSFSVAFLVVFIVWPVNVATLIAIVIGVAVFTALLHVIYAHLRYKAVVVRLETDTRNPVGAWWM